ncbi:MAG: DUF1292 domain-containing protein, partial [Clostridia bacterium]|nr:DUF1292 domain-containing protein [Clostridia bacterium]
MEDGALGEGFFDASLQGCLFLQRSLRVVGAEAEVEGDGELVILEGVDEEGEDLLVPIEDDDTFEEIAGIFEERLADYY